MTAATIPLAIIGVAGRMGRLVARLAGEDHGYAISGALERTEVARLLPDIGLAVGLGPLRVGASADPAVALHGARVAIDFSAPAAVESYLDVCCRHSIAAVIGSTALSDSQRHVINEASRAVPLLVAPNLSMGVYVLTSLVQHAADLLQNKGFDCEVLEVHHRRKKDAPSGTALALSAAIQERGFARYEERGRSAKSGKRGDGSIGVAALRGGDVAGEHTVYFLGNGERIEVTHRASSAEVLARGALEVARWIITQPPGCYSMADFFGADDKTS